MASDPRPTHAAPRATEFSTDLDASTAREFLAHMESRLVERSPSWAEIGPDDPRRVLVEVFAESLARLSSEAGAIEESLYPRLLELLGAEPLGPRPAHGVVCFRVDEEVGEVNVPAGTMVAPARAAGEPHVAFVTTSDAPCSTAELKRVVLTCAESCREIIPYPHHGWNESECELFGGRESYERRLYLGDLVLSILRSRIGELTLEWGMDGEQLLGALWEFSATGGWRSLPVEWEEARGVGGEKVLRMKLCGPLFDLTEATVDCQASYWIRCVLPHRGDVRLTVPQWVSWAGSGAPVAVEELDSSAWRFPRPVVRILTCHEDLWGDHSVTSLVAQPGSLGRRHFDVSLLPHDEDPAVYFGWDRGCAAGVYVDVGRASGWHGALTRGAVLKWEISTPNGFQPFVVSDGTQGFSRPGLISWAAEEDMAPIELHGERLVWVRARWVGGTVCEPLRMRRVLPHAAVVQQRTEHRDVRFELELDARGKARVTLPIDDGQPLKFDVIDVQDDTGEWRSCRRIPRASDRLETVVGSGDVDPAGDLPGAADTDEPATPEVPQSGGRFRLHRRRDGTLELDLSAMWRGRRMLRLPRVLLTQGALGNRSVESIRVLEGDLPGVTQVVQPLATSGGADAESSQCFRRRAVCDLRMSRRVVTAEDIAHFCKAYIPEVARVEVASQRDRLGYLVVTLVRRDRRPLPPGLRQDVAEELGRKVPLGTLVEVTAPGFVPVEVSMTPAGGEQLPSLPLRRALVACLEAFFDPVTGGEDRLGLPARGWLDDEGLSVVLGRICRRDWIAQLPRHREGRARPGVEEWGAILRALEGFDAAAWLTELRVPGATVPPAWCSPGRVDDGYVFFPRLEELVFTGNGPE